jgi:hypothetical protein
MRNFRGPCCVKHAAGKGAGGLNELECGGVEPRIDVNPCVRNYFQRLVSLAVRSVLLVSASSVGSMRLSVRSLASARFPFLFHEIHRRTRLERDKFSTPGSPEFWTCGRGWRWRRTHVGSLDLGFHAWRRLGCGIDEVCRKGCTKLTNERRHRRRYHPTVMALQLIAAKITGRAPHGRRRHPTPVALHGTAAKITGHSVRIRGRAPDCRRRHLAVIALHGTAPIIEQSSGLGLWAKHSKEYYCRRPNPPATFHGDLPTHGIFEFYVGASLANHDTVCPVVFLSYCPTVSWLKLGESAPPSHSCHSLEKSGWQPEDRPC